LPLSRSKTSLLPECRRTAHNIARIRTSGRSRSFFSANCNSNMKILTPRLLVALSLLGSGSLLGARASESPIEADGWKGVSPRDEIRPSFEWVAKGGPSARGSLIIRTDDREGLDGHWVKTFPVRGGHDYDFRALRRVTNVPVPRRS